MKRATERWLVFTGAAVFAAALYALTKPDGLPWGVKASVAGRHALPLCAVAAGCLGAVASRYFGWKVGVAAALAWSFVPGIWNGAILGEPFAGYAALAVVALWMLNVILLRVLRRAISVHRSASERGQGALSDADKHAWRTWVNRLAGWAFLAVALVFALVFISLHDWQLGEPASVYARGVVEEAGERIIVLNGVADEQVESEVKRNSEKGRSAELATISLEKGNEYREKIVAWAKAEFPSETNLWVAAQVGVSVFLDAAKKAHPERFYLMNGESTTLAAWEKRWSAFEPYLKSSDKFVPVGRRAFAYEANAVGNALQEKDKAAAWKLYGRILEEVERGNVSALFNRDEMMRKGYRATKKEEGEIRKMIDDFLKVERNRKDVREIVRAAGSVKTDPELLAKLSAARKERVEAAKAKGEKLQLTSEAKTLIEWNDQMVVAANKGEMEKAGVIAREILSNPQWRGWVPAHAMMGNVAASKGDYAEAEVFYRAATSAKNETPEAIWNNYADTLLHLGKLDEAEAILRRRIAKTDEKAWMLRLTLSEVLTAKSKRIEAQSEAFAAIRKDVLALVRSVMQNAPCEYQREVRAKQKSGEILK